MRLVRRTLVAAVVACALAPAAGAATCVNFGIYQDDPLGTLSGKGAKTSVFAGANTISTYVTGGKLLDPRLIATANRTNKQLLVSWAPDSGADGPKQPKFRLTKIVKGGYDASLAALGKQFKQVKRGVIFRPMYEANLPNYAWSGLANGNSTKDYLAAWQRVAKQIRASAGLAKVRLLWSPYARSFPDSGPNGIPNYFPGKQFVDLVGASAYNVGTTPAGYAWTEPVGLFQTAYSTILALAGKPFWIAETGSTATGGDKAAWISSLASLQSTMPKLAGVVWFDAKDATGDYRLTGKPVVDAFKSAIKKGCK